jgi:hypothetical protein
LANYLDRLVNRFQGAPAAIQPRVPSLFEPSRSESVRGLLPSENDGPSIHEVERIITARGAENKLESQIVQDRKPPVEQKRQMIPSIESLVRPAPAAKEPVALGDLYEREPPNEEIRRHSIERHGSAFAQNEVRHDTLPPLLVHRPARGPLRRLEPTMPVEGSDSIGRVAGREIWPGKQTGSRAEHSSLEPAESPGRTKTGRGNEIGNVPRRNGLQVSPAATAQNAFPMEKHEAAQKNQPSINVVIGRIMVEAVLPAVPARPQAPAIAPPKLSLEDYLKQRGARS